MLKRAICVSFDLDDMSYRKELEQLVVELEERARTLDFANDPKANEKLIDPDQLDVGD